MRLLSFIATLTYAAAAHATCLSDCTDLETPAALLGADCSPHAGAWPSGEPVVLRSTCYTECCAGGPECGRGPVSGTIMLEPGGAVLTHDPDHACADVVNDQFVFVSAAPLADGVYHATILNDAVTTAEVDFRIGEAAEGGCTAAPGGGGGAGLVFLVLLGGVRRR